MRHLMKYTRDLPDGLTPIEINKEIDFEFPGFLSQDMNYATHSQ